jgi:hypothetical protein
MDVVTNVKAPLLKSIAEGLLAYMDGVLAQEGGQALVDRMEKASPENDDRYGTSGFEDNPRP